MSLFKRIISYLVRQLIRLSVYFNCPKLTALFFSLIARQLNPSGTYTVLCITKSIFIDDIKAMAAYGRGIKYVLLHAMYLRIIFYSFIKVGQLTHTNYHLNKCHDEKKKEYYLYLNKMFPLLKKLIAFDAVLSGNYVYSYQQELARICGKKGVPFIVLHKEGIAVPDKYPDLLRTYSNRKFIGAKMLVYNDAVKEALLGFNISGLHESKVEVVGVPRLDAYFNKKTNTGKCVAFFSFYPKDKFSYFMRDENTFQQIEERSANFHRQIMDFSLKHSDIRVVIKTKASPYCLPYVQKILMDNFKTNIHNLCITNSANTFDLVQDSNAIIGFNSVVLIEGLLAGKIILSPNFGDLLPDMSWDYFKGYPELINYVKHDADLEEYIINSNKYLKYDPKRKKDFLEGLISKPDGRASIRAEDSIIKTIESFRNIDSPPEN